jgi:hypothetical protein
MSDAVSTLPIAVVGAGPVGLAAAAHLLSRGMIPLVFEAGPSPGANLHTYAHVQLFSPWRYNVDKASRALLEQQGWKHPAPEALPTAGEIVRSYLGPLAKHPALAPHIRFAHRVVAISRASVDKVKTAKREAAPFALRVHTPDGEREFRAQAVIDASGTWNQPNPMGANGLPALGELALTKQISYGMPDILGRDRARYEGRRVLVVGSGHSAAGNLIALAELAESVPTTQIVWAIRGDNWTRIFGGGEADGLPARGQLGQRLKQLRDSGRLQVHTGFRIHELRSDNGRITAYAEVESGERPRISGIEEIIVSTGARPDFSTTRELRLKLDYWLESTEALAPLIDPNEHSCGTVRPHGHRELAHPEVGYYAVGAKSYGRAPTFLLATGYEQVRSVVAALAGDLAAADDVQLDLPETGVCSVSFGPEKETASSCCGTSPPELSSVPATSAASEGCCGGPPKDAANACCVADEQAKATGGSGCGCSTAVPVSAVTPQRKACCG